MENNTPLLQNLVKDSRNNNRLEFRKNIHYFIFSAYQILILFFNQDIKNDINLIVGKLLRPIIRFYIAFLL